MVTIGERIKARRLELGLSVDQVAERIGKNRATVYRYESNEIEKFPLAILYPLAEVLRTTPADLMGWAEAATGLLSDNIMPMPQTQRTPLLGIIACGEPILAEENIAEYVDIPDFIHCDFALRCKGDSMINARIYEGDIVCIRKQETVENGEIAAVLVDNEATLKRVYFDGNTLTLMPENPAYRPKVYVGDQIQSIRILGKATHFISAVR